MKLRAEAHLGAEEAAPRPPEDVTWRGTFRSPLEGVTTTPRPVQRPHPTLWVGSGSAASADLAAELGLPLMLPSTLRDPGVYLDVVAGYRRHAPGRVALPSHVFVAEDDARERWRPYLQAYATFASPWRGDGREIDIDALMEGAAICGGPARWPTGSTPSRSCSGSTRTWC